MSRWRKYRNLAPIQFDVPLRSQIGSACKILLLRFWKALSLKRQLRSSLRSGRYFTSGKPLACSKRGLGISGKRSTV